MNDASETLYRLKPVTYRYKKEIDVTNSLDYGLVAEEVASIDLNLVACGKDGQVKTVRYAAVNAMLLNEFLKAHTEFIQEQNKVSNLQATVAQQQKQIEAPTARLQEVSAQLAAANPSLADLKWADPQQKRFSIVRTKRRRALRHELGNRYAVACLGKPSQSGCRLQSGLRSPLISRGILEIIGIRILAKCAIVRDIQRHGISNAF